MIREPKRCTMDCKEFGAGHGVTFWRGEPHHVGDFHQDIIAYCQPLYCKDEAHPNRGPLPGCTRWATHGALLSREATCFRDEVEDDRQGTLF